MKSMIAVLIFVMFLFPGCSGEPVSVGDDGGTYVQITEAASKEIFSTEITSFSCTFSTLAIPEEDSYIAGNIYSLEFLEGKCKYSRLDRFGEESNFEFISDDNFAEQLQEIIVGYDFACYNGYYSYVSGLPDFYGAELSVLYATGEEIAASDNEECFLPLEALEKLEKLFKNQT